MEVPIAKHKSHLVSHASGNRNKKTIRKQRAVRNYGFLLVRNPFVLAESNPFSYGTNLFAYMGLVYLNTFIIHNQENVGYGSYGNGFDDITNTSFAILHDFPTHFESSDSCAVLYF